MMKPFALLICLLVVAACSGEDPNRAKEPSFKGMELYTWIGEEGRCFSLFAGTNRLKPKAEITRTEHTFTDLALLKEQIRKLARGESIYLRNLTGEPIPGETMQALRDFCESLEIKLVEV